LGCTLLGLGLMLFKKRKHLNATINKFNAVDPNTGTAGEELSETKYKDQIETLSNEKKNLLLKLANLELNQKSNESSFFGQILVSAGPRKSSRDSELGEDTAGFCVNGNRAFFWVLDGTSDSPIVAHGRKEIMSSRLLAQHLGINLQKGITNSDLNSQIWLNEAIKTTEKQWQQTISELSEEVKKSIIEDLSGRADIADVSTTALVGIINIDGKVSITRIGDSKIFCLNQEDKLIEDDLTQKPQSDSYGRLYARATLDKDSITLDFTKSKDILRFHGTTIEGVKTILAFSDGIGPITENFLREHSSKFPLEDIQKRIASIPQQTYDDKSLLMIQIRQ
jgi:hypothetical protein